MISYDILALSRIPLKQDDMKGISNNELRLMIQIGEGGNGRIMCRCQACSKRKRRQVHTNVGRGDEPVSFTFNKIDGICQLWLCSFEQLSGIVGSERDVRVPVKSMNCQIMLVYAARHWSSL